MTFVSLGGVFKDEIPYIALIFHGAKISGIAGFYSFGEIILRMRAA